MEKTTAVLPFPITNLFSSLRLNPYLITLSALPFILFLLQPSWILTTLDFLDPWVYFGYFKDLKQHLQTFPGAYYGTRLPWILVGHLAYKIFTPLMGKYFLYLLLYYSSLFSLYGILKKTIGLKTAFIAAIFLGFYKHFLVSSSNEYIDGIVQSYFFLTLYFLTPTKEKVFVIYRFLIAGAFFCLLISTHLFLISYLPLVGCFYLFFHRPRTIISFLQHILLFVLGFLIMTLILCSINYLLCHEFFFFSPMIAWTKNFVKESNPWWMPFYKWSHLLNTYVLGMMVFICSIFTIIFSKRIPKNLPKSILLFFQILFVINSLIFIYFEFVKRQPFLEYQYYYSYLTPILFLALGSLLAPVVESATSKQFITITVFTFALCLVEVLFSSRILHTYERNIPTFWPYFLGLGILFLLSITILKKHVAKLCCLFLFIPILVAANGKNIYLNALEQMPFRISKNIFLSINDSLDIIKKMDRSGHSYFWYPRNEPYYSSIFRSISSAYLWGYRLINEDFPSTEGHSDYPLVDLTNKNFFVLSTSPSINETVNDALFHVGFEAEEIGCKTVKRGSLEFYITHFKAEKIEDKSLHDNH